MHGYKRDGTACTLLQERAQPVQTLRLTSGRIGADTVADGGGAELDFRTGVGFHVLIKGCHGGGDRHARLVWHVRFVKGHEMHSLA